MKKIFSIVMVGILMLTSNVFAAKKAYEVPLEILHYSREEGKKSMANEAIIHTAKVKEENGKEIYEISFKPLQFSGLEGKVTNLFVLEGNSKVEAKKNEVNGNSNFEFSRNIPHEKEIEIAVWVDAMDELAGGTPGSGEQKAILSLDWSKIDVKSKDIKDDKIKTEDKNSDSIKININGKEVQMDTKPYIENGRTMVPVRFISESLGLKVDWKAENQTVTINENINLKIGKAEIEKDGVKTKIDAPAVIKDSRTFVPLRAIAEISGANVEWKAETRTVVIGK